jgi:hypothetical protein
VTDLNDGSPGDQESFAPHGIRGPIMQAGDHTNPGAHGAPSAAIGGKGGNVGLLSGAVLWRSIKAMGVYRGSQSHSSEGCWEMW